MKVFVVLGKSESSDEYVAVFQKKPTKVQLGVIANLWDGGEGHDGPGYAGSYVHIEVSEQEVR